MSTTTATQRSYRPAPTMTAVQAGLATIARGEEGESVKALQKKLNTWGAGLAVDGKMGQATEQALKRYGFASGRADKSVFEAARPKAKPAASRGSGPTRNVRGFREVDEQKLRTALGTEGQHMARPFIEAGRKHSLDPLFLAGISMQETGHFTSEAFTDGRHNAMGVTGSKKRPRGFTSHQESIFSMAAELSKKDGYYVGRNTVGTIAQKYAPIDAHNDPDGLNHYWAKNVGDFVDQLERATR